VFIDDRMTSLAGAYPFNRIPLPADFISSPILEKVYEGKISPEWV
jgi:hypothetical protein